jgi:TetR/AcrR family acrAB operon transcriptional repressor
LAGQRAFEAASVAGVEQGRFDLAGNLEDMSAAIIALTKAVVLPLRHKSGGHRMMVVLARTLLRVYAKGDEMLQLARTF